MKTPFIAVFAGLLILAGCADFGPAISKTNLGNLEINITAPEGLDPRAARIYIDEVFVGNVSSRMPVLQLKKGKHVVKVELEEAETYIESITILGEPNHQVLNVAMKRKTKS
jgi:hypothetical protein